MRETTAQARGRAVTARADVTEMAEEAHRETSRAPEPASAPHASGRAAITAALERVMRSAPAEMAYATIELHRPVHDDAGLFALLHRAVQVTRRCVPGTEGCSITTQFRPGSGSTAPFTVASSGPRAQQMDQQQYAIDDGPALRAIRSKRVVAMDPDELASQCPQLATTAIAAGVRGCLSAPLAAPPTGRSAVDNGAPAGSINLYRGGDGRFGPESEDFLHVLVEYVSRGLADFAALHSAQQQTAQLKQAMASRGPIEQAKGILMAVHRISEADAFDLLRTESQSTNTKLHRVAGAFVAAQSAQPVVTHDDGAATVLNSALRSAFDHAPAGMAMTTPDTVLLSVNAAFARLLDKSADALVGTRLLIQTHADDVPLLREKYCQLRTGSSRVVAMTVRLCGAKGHPVPVRISACPAFPGTSDRSHLVVHLQATAD